MSTHNPGFMRQDDQISNSQKYPTNTINPTPAQRK